MRRKLKLILLVLPLVLLAIGVILFWLYRGDPSWYEPQALTPQQQAQAADAADRKAADAYRWASQLRADEQRAIHNQETRPQQPAPYTISFTEAELNAFFQKWDAWYRWRDHYGAFVTDPTVVLKKGRIILAGRMQELGSVVSCHFLPGLDTDGDLRLNLDAVQAGRLPMPRATWQRYQDQVLDALRSRLPAWRRAAGIAINGEANDDAVKAGAAELILGTLNDEPAEPVLFLPTDGGQPVPVRLTGVSVTDAALTLIVEPMTREQRAALLQRLRDQQVAAARDGS